MSGDTLATGKEEVEKQGTETPAEVEPNVFQKQLTNI